MSITITPTRKAVAIAGVAFATALAGCGSSSSSTASSNTAAAAAAPQGSTPGGPNGTTPGRGGFRGGGFDTAALAKALGVTEAKLQAAMQSIPRPTGGVRPNGTTPRTSPNGTTPGQGGGFGFGGTERYAAIAKALGLSEAKVQKAYESVMPQGGQGGPPNGGQGGTPPSGAAPAAAGAPS